MAAVTDVIARGLALACHDISDGGLATALSEMMLCSAPDEALGIEVDVGPIEGAPDVDRACRWLFCENGGYVFEIASEHTDEVALVLNERGAWHARIGRTTDERALVIRAPGISIRLSEEAMSDAWSRGAADLML
jgi:phosphoribosylformylglycinamidine synthase